MENFSTRFFTVANIFTGYLYKWFVDFGIIKVPNLNPFSENERVVVSLTSYGRRVNQNVVYYTIVSLLRQTYQPSSIILWLSEDEFSDCTLPKSLLALKNKGVDIKYCKDIKSYKKLIPTLRIEKNSVIVTFDDDNIYKKNTLKKLIDAHNSYPDEIICLAAKNPIFEDGLPTEYNNWKRAEYYSHSDKILPIGYGGILYPVNSLVEDVCDEEIFMKLCPNADDLWFWFCGIRNRTKKFYIGKNYMVLSFDNFYQLTHTGAALTHRNSGQGENDNQLKALFEHYNYRVE